MTQWEYDRVTVENDGLNALGLLGWEAYAVAIHNGILWHFIKRPKQND